MIVCGRKAGLVNVCLVPLGLWAISGSGPGLFVPPLAWTGLTVPSGTVQTRLQTFPGKGQRQPGEEAGDRGRGVGEGELVWHGGVRRGQKWGLGRGLGFAFPWPQC